MKTINTIVIVVLSGLLLGACGGGSSSSGSGGDSASNKDASKCVSRTLRTVYVNECSYAINVILFKAGESPFRINANDAVTRSSSGSPFGACRAPSIPILNSDNSGFRCS